jgi:hypothetical protein
VGPGWGRQVLLSKRPPKCSGEWSLDEALGIDIAGTGSALAALGAGLLGGLGAVVSGRLADRLRRAKSLAAR